MTRVDLSTVADLQEASRGEGARASDPADTCYFIHNGVYAQSGSSLLLYLRQGGVSPSAPRRFVGESRSGVVLRGRASTDLGVSHL